MLAAARTDEPRVGSDFLMRRDGHIWAARLSATSALKVASWAGAYRATAEHPPSECLVRRQP